MKPFLTSKRKMLDLVFLVAFNLIFYFFWSSLEFNILFNLGFIWNWVASQNLDHFFEVKRYRFSTLKLVFNLQHIILKPLMATPFWVGWIVSILPAGLLWSAVIYFNDSQMPWWATFIGSLTFELIQLEAKFFGKPKEPAH